MRTPSPTTMPTPMPTPSPAPVDMVPLPAALAPLLASSPRAAPAPPAPATPSPPPPPFVSPLPLRSQHASVTLAMHLQQPSRLGCSLVGSGSAGWYPWQMLHSAAFIDPAVGSSHRGCLFKALGNNPGCGSQVVPDTTQTALSAAFLLQGPNVWPFDSGKQAAFVSALQSALPGIRPGGITVTSTGAPFRRRALLQVGLLSCQHQKWHAHIGAHTVLV